MPTRRAMFALLLVLSAGAVHARTVYKCTSRHGVAFQDEPCAPGSEESLMHVAGDAQAAAPPAEATGAAAPGRPRPKPAPAPTRAKKPLPPLWLCTNVEDGSGYASRNGPTPPRLVPLGVFGFPRQSLAQAYSAGSNVMSAPELNKPPVDRSPAASAAASYTQVQDPCIRADAEQTCAWLRQEYDRVDEQLGNARFNDERARLQSEEDRLEDDLGGCG